MLTIKNPQRNPLLPLQSLVLFLQNRQKNLRKNIEPIIMKVAFEFVHVSGIAIKSSPSLEAVIISRPSSHKKLNMTTPYLQRGFHSTDRYRRV